MEKKNLDWKHIGFAYHTTDYRYVADYKDGKWQEGYMSDSPNIVLNECAGIMQYCQEVFEGLKAYTTKQGKIVTFRPDMNAERMYNTAARLEMPSYPKEKFVEAVLETVRANAAWVPPYGTGCSLYIRPFMIGSGPQIGVAPAPSFLFRIFVMPVGAYYKGAVKPQKLVVSDWDRAAPHGTGDIKAGLNYAMSLHPTMDAHRAGYAENLYLDPQTRTYVEEAGGANVLFVDKDDNLIAPKSTSILPSYTRRSLVYVAEHYLGLNVIERKVRFDEVKDMKECCLCGTAAVIAPVGLIHTHEGDIVLPSGMDKMGEISGRLRKTLTGIQDGEIAAPEGWIREVC